jgi:hypothetical protein
VTRATNAVAPGAVVEVRVEEKSIPVEGFDDATAISAAINNAAFEFGGATV